MVYRLDFIDGPEQLWRSIDLPETDGGYMLAIVIGRYSGSASRQTSEPEHDMDLLCLHSCSRGRRIRA